MRYASFLLASVAVTLLAGESFACNRVSSALVISTTTYTAPCPPPAAPVISLGAYMPMQNFALVPVDANPHYNFAARESFRFRASGGGYGSAAFSSRSGGSGGLRGVGAGGLGGLIGDALPLAGAGLGAAIGGPFGAVAGAGLGEIASGLFGGGGGGFGGRRR